jgi:hypothetical protein
MEASSVQGGVVTVTLTEAEAVTLHEPIAFLSEVKICCPSRYVTKPRGRSSAVSGWASGH